MALTAEQKELIVTMLANLNAEITGIIMAREDVLAAVRIDATNPDDITALTVIQAAKARAVVHANDLVTLLTA
jgi:hypothetical protein